jgi:hypothetical protein
MMQILGYSEDPKLNDNREYEWDSTERSYIFRPITESKRGMITTAAVMLCGQCQHPIKSMGGPGYRSYCLKCYDSLKVLDFANGHEHVIKDDYK